MAHLADGICTTPATLPTAEQGEYGFQQTLTSTLQANTNYSLQVEIGNIASGTGIDGTFFNLDGFPGYRVDLLAGITVLNQDNNTFAGSIGEGLFSTSLLRFSTGASHPLLGQALGIRLVNLNVLDAGFPLTVLEVDFDNVRLSAVSAVPEPTSLLLIALMTAPFLIRRLKARSRSYIISLPI